MAYTKDQLRAIVVIDYNLQVVACAGAGKTQVVAERVVEILRKKRGAGVGPANILAFTFTERAAAELKDRITECVRLNLGEIPGMAEMYVGTIHGYCLSLLQSQLPEYFKYQVLNDVQTRLLVDRASKKCGLADLGLKRYLESPLYLEILDIVREADIDRAKLKEHPVLTSLGKYINLLDSKRYLDYTEIMVRAVRALRDDTPLRRRIAEQVKFFIIDEYQDVNPLQEQLIQTLQGLGANICVVGDDDQTIYQWRGSSVRNILTFAKRYPRVKTVPIQENFRSSPGVVDAARLVVEHNDPDRLPKKMVSAKCQDFERGDLLWLGFKSPEDEARWIANKAKSMLGTPFRDKPGASPRGLARSDIAILLRSVRRTGDLIVQALRREGLRVIVAGMTGLFDTPEVRACVTLFDFMVERSSKKQLVDAWLSAELGISKSSLNKAVEMADAQRHWDETKRWSVYNLQRTYLSFLETAGVREETVPEERGETVFYNLGKFSQVISDFEQIHFQSSPQRKYESFAGFLTYQAPNYYPEGWQDSSYAKPDAVQVMTVHQAKGMEWPVVFIPCLQRNRFPAKPPGGKNKWHILPRDAIRDADRFDGSVEDERRLFYVALTRSKKHLYCSWAPDGTKKLYQSASVFASEFKDFDGVLTREPKRTVPKPLPPQPRREIANVALSFSELKYFFECPYQFKLRFVYGFNPPLHEAIGYGKSLHDALSEIHQRAMRGEILSQKNAEELIDRHLNIPFAYDELRRHLREAGIDAISRYLRENKDRLNKTEHVEQVIEIGLGNGMVVNGRIDLIRRMDTKELVIVDFKSTERAQEEEVTSTQLHIYALGYKELTGKSADLIEIYNLDHGITKREEVDSELEQQILEQTKQAGAALRANLLPRLETWSHACGGCDLVGICRQRQDSPSSARPLKTVPTGQSVKGRSRPAPRA
jgi:DNA helicase II / ATP-dependent DNA helicase PcrA